MERLAGRRAGGDPPGQSDPHRGHRTTATGITWGTEAERAAVGRDFDRVAAWARTHQRPILLGEFGAYDKGDITSRAGWTATVARAAEARGFAWSYWQFDSDFVAFDIDA